MSTASLPKDEPLVDLRAEIQATLGNHPHLKGRGLRCDTSQGKVVLRGTVASYYQKQLAQESLRKIVGRVAIDNQLLVALPVPPLPIVSEKSESEA